MKREIKKNSYVKKECTDNSFFGSIACELQNVVGEFIHCVQTGEDMSEFRDDYIIGINNNFDLYMDLTLHEALKIFDTLDERQAFGTKISSKGSRYTGYYEETFNCMECNSGLATIRIQPIGKIYNRNDLDKKLN